MAANPQARPAQAPTVKLLINDRAISDTIVPMYVPVSMKCRSPDCSANHVMVCCLKRCGAGGRRPRRSHSFHSRFIRTFTQTS